MGLTVRTSCCDCGQVRFKAIGDPIVTAVCYCSDCQKGGQLIQALPDAQPVLDQDGGTPYLTYRDDRFRCVAGQHLLEGHKLKASAPTQRFVATCCNSGMYLKFKYGHWVSAYRYRFADEILPAVEMRTNLRRRQSALVLPQDAPSYSRFPLSLFAKLFRSRIDMALGR